MCLGHACFCLGCLIVRLLDWIDVVFGVGVRLLFGCWLWFAGLYCLNAAGFCLLYLGFVLGACLVDCDC